MLNYINISLINVEEEMKKYLTIYLQKNKLIF